MTSNMHCIIKIKPPLNLTNWLDLAYAMLSRFTAEERFQLESNHILSSPFSYPYSLQSLVCEKRKASEHHFNFLVARNSAFRNRKNEIVTLK